MFFTPNKIKELLDIIDLNHIMFTLQTVGVEYLSVFDKKVLSNFGIDLDEVKAAYPELLQSFHWGRLSQALDQYAKKVTYGSFMDYLKRGQYIPLNESEKYALHYVSNNTYNHIKGLGDRVKQTVTGLVTVNDPDLRASYEDIIRNSVKRAVVERNSVRQIISDIGNKTGDWERDLGRIAETELNNAYQYGRSEQIKREYGSKSLVYKQVYDGACRHCIRLYLTAGIGSRPRVFTLKELVANGNNYGLKVVDWKPVLESTHPWCRCQLKHLEEGYVWNDELKMFAPVKVDKEKRTKKGVKISVGDAVYEL